MQLLNLFLSILFFFINCNNNMMTNITKEDIKIDTLQFYIKSPSERCSYEIIINREGIGKLALLKYNGKGNKEIKKTEIKISQKKDIDELKTLFTELNDSDIMNGKLWKGGWKYKVYYNGKKKIEIYKKQESKFVMKLLYLIDKYSTISIDYKCF